MKSFPRRLAILAAATLAAANVYAQSQDEYVIEEIVVQGEFRDAGSYQIPSSVSVVRLADQRDAINHLEEVLGRIANVNFSSGAARARFIQIRGIGERGQFAEPINSSVGLLVDGVDLSAIGTVATLHDVEQVEVFRGPQGTLYGANALAGLVNVVTRSPGDSWESEIEAEVGDYGARGFGFATGGPLSDQVGLRIAAKNYQDDGFIDNEFLNDDDTTNRDETTVRVKLQGIGETTDWQIAAGRIDADNGYDAFSLDNNRNTLSDQPGEDVQETNYFSANFGAELDAVRAEVAIGYADSDIYYGYDEDWTFDGFHPDGYMSTDHYARERETTTLDLRFLSQPNEGLFGGSTSWVFGVFALQQDVDLTRTYTFLPGPFDSEFEIDRLAVYGEVTRPLNDTWRLTAGLRLERHESEYQDTEGVRFSPDDDMVGGRLLLERDVGESSLFYAAVSRGYKAGGFNTNGTLDADLRVFDPETLWNGEVGLKGRLAGGRFSYNAVVFWMPRRDVQIATSEVRMRSDMSSEFIDYIGNASEGFNRGLELEGEWFVNENLLLFASVGWLDTEYDDFVNAAGEVLDGRRQAQAPDYQVYLGGEWRAGPWFARVELEARDDYFFSDSHEERSDSYELLHASVGYEGERFDVRLWGRNLTDEDYFVRGFRFGNDPRDGYQTRGFTQLGEPARVGLSAKLRF